MLPTREQAMDILEEAYRINPGPWKEHSKVAAECAYRIACECNGLDEEKAYKLGLLHDVGRKFGNKHLTHVIDGYHYMMKLGYDEAARICITHSFAVQDLNTYVGNKDVTEKELQEIVDLLASYEYDDYDRLIQLCDSIAMADGPVDMEIRMGDVKKRYGGYPEVKWNKHLELKSYFEDKMGRKLADVVS